MNKILTILAALCAIACTSSKTTIYDFSAGTNSGDQLNFSQYDGLEALFQQYAPRGFVVIGFPCDQFGHQEPGTNAEIEEFCRLNHGVTFPLMAKSDVNGENANEVFKWNFTKFLIDRKGRVVARFEPVVTPEQIVPEIEALL